ncbi:ATP-binding cassette domain-containing protein [Jiangella asiatica]|uniref:ABC transporter ATP-binding protein n=1 Tax=Jiangella asiatica TaxID=2530372 RepID=A0A4R5DBE4_9ACTN|nr:ABC transporter ATP-binding protein [Jiangella asiatica]TDE09131.1 ABC transporter ATP-binding protein [Jiangella asiatica]
MRRELRFGVASLRRRPLLELAAWSVPDAVPTAIYGLAIARAVDEGFLAGRPGVGLAWLAVLVGAACLGAVGSRQVFRRLGDLVEPVRDDLVRRVVTAALRQGVAGRPDDGAVARLTRQVEIVRDTYAGLIVVARDFVVRVVGVVAGLLTIAPVIVVLVLPPFLLGFAVAVLTLGVAAARVRTSVRADERAATAAGAVVAGTRDVVARGAEGYAMALVAGPVGEHAAAERALARVGALRTLCFALGGWLPLVILLAAGPWLVERGVSAGAIMGGLTYVLVGLHPALETAMGALSGSGLRYVVTLGRILDATTIPAARPPVLTAAPNGHAVAIDAASFAYGSHAEPVVRDLDLVVDDGDHLAIVGPSGIGKSTLAALVCGLLRPDEGRVLLGGVPAADLPAQRLAATRVLIPQEAYVFEGTIRDNVTYLRPTATTAEISDAVEAVGAGALLSRLGGVAALVRPEQLSAGERQLLALVRAYLSPAPLAVLDEATCHLDPVAERLAEAAFARRGGTLIVIAHRISSALHARRILVLDGASATVGRHDELQLASPLYRELLGHWTVAATEGSGQIQPAS